MGGKPKAGAWLAWVWSSLTPLGQYWCFLIMIWWKMDGSAWLFESLLIIIWFNDLVSLSCTRGGGVIYLRELQSTPTRITHVFHPAHKMQGGTEPSLTWRRQHTAPAACYRCSYVLTHTRQKNFSQIVNLGRVFSLSGTHYTFYIDVHRFRRIISNPQVDQPVNMNSYQTVM